MTIEEKVFERKRFVKEKMLDFGFTENDGGYCYETDFMDGDFSAVLQVSKSGEIACRVVDKMNGEEYSQIRIDSSRSGYVQSVRTAYEELLGHIAEECCKEVSFASDQANRIAERIAGTYDTLPDYPWDGSGYQHFGVFRHSGNSKWFALIMNVKRRVLTKDHDESAVDVVNLKAERDAIAKLTQRPGIYPAYHMNRKYWISVALDGLLTDDEVMALVSESFRLTE